jgi:hypothetical protein
MLLSIADDGVKRRPEMKASGILLHLNNALLYLTSDQDNMFGIKRVFHSPFSQGVTHCGGLRFGNLKQCFDVRVERATKVMTRL